MATHKRARKNIKEDHLVTYMVEAGQWAQEHFNQVIIGVVVLVVAIAAIVFTANSRQSSGAQAARQMGNALALYQSGDFTAAETSFRQIQERFGGRDEVIARFFEAECQLRQGEYATAIGNYDRYLESASRYPLFHASALYGKAICQEGLEDFAGAAATMTTLLGILDKDDPRYLDAAFQAGEFFANAGNTGEAAKYFRQVAESADGDLQHRATVAAALLEG